MELNSNEMDKMQKSSEEVCMEYKLSEEEHKKIAKNINEIMMAGKTPVENPIAIIDIAPPGSGKTGLNGMAVKQFNDNNVVVINSDELKPFHPKIDEIAKLYPKFYTKVTNQESNSWTDNLFENAVDNSYNIIFEGTGRNLKLLKKMIEKMSNYRIIVRGMAVNELNCLMSIVERYIGQVEEKGWGRLVTVEHFYKAYEEMLDTIEQLEKLGIADTVEVYMRGNEPTEPQKIYSSDTREFANSKLAVITVREIDRKKSDKYYETDFSNKLAKRSEVPEEKEILEKINSLYSEKEKKQTGMEL